MTAKVASITAMIFFHLKPLVPGNFPPLVSRQTNFHTSVSDLITAEYSPVCLSSPKYTGVAELTLFKHSGTFSKNMELTSEKNYGSFHNHRTRTLCTNGYRKLDRMQTYPAFYFLRSFFSHPDTKNRVSHLKLEQETQGAHEQFTFQQLPLQWYSNSPTLLTPCLGALLTPWIQLSPP